MFIHPGNEAPNRNKDRNKNEKQTPVYTFVNCVVFIIGLRNHYMRTQDWREEDQNVCFQACLLVS